MVLKLSENALLEIFDEGGLIFVFADCRMIDLDKMTTDIVNKLDGEKTLQAVARELAKEKDMPLTRAKTEVQKPCLELERVGILQKSPDRFNTNTAVEVQYVQNPKIVVNESDHNNGAILFNPGTNRVKTVNQVGWYIWQNCSVAKTAKDIIAQVKNAFEDVPHERVAKDVQDFLSHMSSNDFIQEKCQDRNK
ncbi:PqqD family peptide modification chaperone [candidate division KSB1 bacterium]|nr:PqqD family peptide modification chaperone [candidate division KSB1 bacterium]